MEAFFTNLIYWHWFALAVTLAILDVVIGVNFFLIWCGLAAAVVGLSLVFIPSMAWEYQLLIFSIGVMASLVLWRWYGKRLRRPTDTPNLNRRAQQYVGRIFTLESPIVNGRGRVKVDDSIWRIEGVDCSAGTRVRVRGVDGVILVVETVK